MLRLARFFVIRRSSPIRVGMSFNGVGAPANAPRNIALSRSAFDGLSVCTTTEPLDFCGEIRVLELNQRLSYIGSTMRHREPSDAAPSVMRLGLLHIPPPGRVSRRKPAGVSWGG